MKEKQKIPDEIFDYVSYDESSPSCLVWKKLPHTRAKKKVGEPAGSRKGCWTIGFRGVSYRVHRVIYAIHHQDPGDFEIDHIDRDPYNNKISNLRKATRQQNGWNRGKQNIEKTSEFIGVSSCKGLWRVACHGVDVCFESEIEAAIYYNKLVKEHRGEFAVLNNIEENL